jgi:hypothetical protein
MKSNILLIFCQRNDEMYKGWIRDIWKEVQVNIYNIYTATTETNNTSEESPNIQL